MDEHKQLEQQRQRLFAFLHNEGIYDQRVLQAMEKVPRELFVPAQLRHHAYEDHALAIEEGQTISQPFIVALMTQALQLNGSERVLEIGTGSGYQTAILARIAAEIYSVERFPKLAALAIARLQELGLHNIQVLVGDGSKGWPEHAPYDRILVTAASPGIPTRLINQLELGGVLIAPVGSRDHQELLWIRRTRREAEIYSLGSCLFVPLIGEEGW
jgi:protein-L-isoaspartate(D-aspartate) O-methyltransferase